jgi:nitroreductase
MKELYESLKKICHQRKSIRSFQEKPVPPDAIEKILEIARTSPYVSGRKNWDIVVVTDRAKIQEACDIVTRICKDVQKNVEEEYADYFREYSRNFTFFNRAPVLFLPCFRFSPALSFMMKAPNERILEWEREGFIKSISCVAMLILLAAQSLGLGGCYMTGPLLAEEEIAKIFGIKKGRIIGAVIPIGYPKDE